MFACLALNVSPKLKAVLVPARQAYSHCASVGKAAFQPMGKVLVFIELGDELLHIPPKLTFSTGKSSPLFWLGLPPISASHCFCVHSVRAIQKPWLSFTFTWFSFVRPFLLSSHRPSGSYRALSLFGRTAHHEAAGWAVTELHHGSAGEINRTSPGPSADLLGSRC